MTHTRQQPETEVDLAITGMTCASCAARIQKKVNALPGVTAAVNYATNSAMIQLDPAQASTDDIVATIRKLGYDAAPPAGPAHDEHQHSSADLARRLALAVPFTIAVVIIGMTPAFHHQPWAPLAGLLLATPVVLVSGWPIHAMAIRGLRHGSMGMDTLVSLGSSVAWLWSLAQVLLGGSEVYAEVSAVVITFVLLGRWLEARATDTQGDALAALSRLQVDQVQRLSPDGTEQTVALAALAVGDRFLVRPGARVATDGVVVSGASTLDLSMVTGESVPVEVTDGDDVIGGCLNGSGRLVVRAGAVGGQTVLARIAELVKQAQHTKAPIERLVDRVAAVFVPVVLAIAAATLAGWLLAGADPAFAISAAVAVLVIACPCALGLATPTALVAGTGRGAQLGILLRGPAVLEAAQRVDTVMLDKTGTVTTGELTVTSVVGGDTGQHAMVAAVEAASEHPIAAAIAAHFADLPRPPVTAFTAHPGLGASGTVAGTEVTIARLDDDATLPGPLAAAAAAAAGAGRTAVVARFDGLPGVVITVSDTLKPDSADAVARLRGLGLTPVLLTGDRRTTAAAVAAQVGIADVIAEVDPAGKVAAVQARQDAGARVAMVGDGLNDAAALAQADLGIAMGTGTDAARDAADITIVHSDPGSVVAAITLAGRTWRTITANLWWAFGYNLVAIPLAISGRLSPMIAGAAMAFSSVLVVGNSLRLRRFTP